MFDRNATTPAEVRRSLQRLYMFGQADGVSIGFNASHLYQVLLGTNPGLSIASGLVVKLADASLSLSASGLSAPVFVASGASHAKGIVPDPGSTAGTTHFLREDATWQTTGTVSSVGLTMPGIFTVSGSPVTSSGTIAVTLNTESANTALMGPASGAAATPAFRLLVPADYPAFVASGASHAAGAVPDPGSTAGTTHFLREDATWQLLPTGAGSPLTTKGDLYVFDAVNDRLAVGSSENFLMADSTAAAGLSYQAAARLLAKAGLGAAVTNTTTRTSFGLTYTLPANYLTLGKHVRCRLFGGYAAQNNTQSFQLAAWLNGIGGAAGDGASPTTSTSGRFFLEIEFIVTATGASGTVDWGGYFYFEAATGVTTTVMGNNSAALNTTIANTVDFSCQWTAASASNSANMRGGTIESL